MQIKKRPYKNTNHMGMSFPVSKKDTAGGLKSDRNGFTKMHVTALFVVRLL